MATLSPFKFLINWASSNLDFSSLDGVTSSEFMLVEVSKAITKSTPLRSIGFIRVPTCGPEADKVRNNSPVNIIFLFKKNKL